MHSWSGGRPDAKRLKPCLSCHAGTSQVHRPVNLTEEIYYKDTKSQREMPRKHRGGNRRKPLERQPLPKGKGPSLLEPRSFKLVLVPLKGTIKAGSKKRERWKLERSAAPEAAGGAGRGGWLRVRAEVGCGELLAPLLSDAGGKSPPSPPTLQPSSSTPYWRSVARGQAGQENGSLKKASPSRPMNTRFPAVTENATLSILVHILLCTCALIFWA